MVDAREVARWLFIWSKNLGNKAVPLDEMYFDSDESRKARGCYSGTVSRVALARRLLSVPVMPSHVRRVPEGEAMSDRVPLFVELCAGLAAVSLGLQGGKYARPPVSRMGSKTGYLLPILRIMGLRPGQGADRYLWCEPDPGCRALLHAYTDREVMQEAARIIRGWKDEEPRALWERLRAEGPIRVGEARETARHCYLSMGSFSQKGVHAGIGTPEGKEPSHNFGGFKPVAEQLLGTMPRSPVVPATVTPDARPIEPADLPPGTVVFMDPPYVGTTGYGNDLPREDVVAMARKWAAAGARVYISEAEPLPALVADGWRTVEITSQRIGQKRTFSKQQREWVTCSVPPAWRPAEQAALF